jgi:quinol monooxygenase YgiN
MDNNITLIAIFTAREELKGRVKSLLASLVEPTRKEDGCCLYNFHVESEKDNSFVFYETWRNQAALDLHMSGSFFKEVMAEVDASLEKPLEVTFLNKQ